MAFSAFSWPFRRRGSGSGAGAGGASKSTAAAEEDEELGVTPQLLDFLRTLSPDAFKAAALQLQGGYAEAAAGDLTSWQERHAVLVLSKAKELAKIRYDLCPRHMKDKQFWRIYFLLAKSIISPYELRAIQKEKIRRMEMDNGKSKEVVTVEVEMQEPKGGRASQPSEVDLESQV
ncbi:hypothetical protein HU200_006656 [Digitaria exilis]|uniref:BSD domain-containing protein n=1 Tax=Digitaria exilis TaxID=1010633 RepID=A0A835FP68_9POAL|nr:hypothetical protein HU200_006656 [Digitaria exilis]